MIVNVLIILLLCVAFFRAQGYLYRKYWFRHLTVELLYVKPDAFEGETVAFWERLTNRKRFPLPFIKVGYLQSRNLRQTDNHGNETYTGSERNTVFFVPGNRSITRKSRLICEKRGFYVINQAKIETANVFLVGFLSMTVPQNAALTVFPREIDVSGLEVPYKQFLGEILSKRFILPDPFEFVGVREYQPFDSLRQINYKAWARTGEPMSNIYGYTVSQEVRIYLNMEIYSRKYWEYVYENSIRLAAFLARYYMERGVAVSFTTNGVDCVTGVPAAVVSGESGNHLREVYECLARIDIRGSLYASPLTAVLPKKNEDDASVIIISAYCGADLLEWYADMRASGGHLLWVMPRAADEAERVPAGYGITDWVVRDE